MVVEITKDKIKITDLNKPKFFFLAFIDPTFKKVIFGLSIQSRIEGKTSNWIWASEFTQLAFDYFNSKKEIEGIRGMWDKKSSNRQELIANLGKGFNIEDIDRNKIRNRKKISKAVLETWTGRMATRLGYSKPVVRKRFWDDRLIKDQAISVLYFK